MENGKKLAFASSFGRHEDDVKNGGLSKREYFAGLAMQGMLCNPTVGVWSDDKIVQCAVGIADELLKALES
jgi:hypothetical protein